MRSVWGQDGQDGNLQDVKVTDLSPWVAARLLAALNAARIIRSCAILPVRLPSFAAAFWGFA